MICTALRQLKADRIIPPFMLLVLATGVVESARGQSDSALAGPDAQDAQTVVPDALASRHVCRCGFDDQSSPAVADNHQAPSIRQPLFEARRTGFFARAV